MDIVVSQIKIYHRYMSIIPFHHIDHPVNYIDGRYVARYTLDKNILVFVYSAAACKQRSLSKIAHTSLVVPTFTFANCSVLICRPYVFENNA